MGELIYLAVPEMFKKIQGLDINSLLVLSHLKWVAQFYFILFLKKNS